MTKLNKTFRAHESISISFKEIVLTRRKWDNVKKTRNSRNILVDVLIIFWKHFITETQDVLVASHPFVVESF
jgi:hypothetical protein